MNVSEFYNEVSRRVDTGKTQINVAETKRVLSEAFVVLSKMSTPDSSALIAKALAAAAKKNAK
ncbi:hypothetical protein Pla175_44920 [Pirellulimonas nuda]|uniref:Uncharacterized protein n=1 Tax=Pirellulimonas nuda TaxID=2528009 RepID=A0A518DHY4_9BACT|nr:hypothetical protein [Pirellulimonas nuda]QDU91074.1 hypothetical protein Pla175_44920 [Pirellulimonas nuda]